MSMRVTKCAAWLNGQVEKVNSLAAKTSLVRLVICNFAKMPTGWKHSALHMQKPSPVCMSDHPTSPA